MPNQHLIKSALQRESKYCIAMGRVVDKCAGSILLIVHIAILASETP